MLKVLIDDQDLEKHLSQHIERKFKHLIDSQSAEILEGLKDHTKERTEKVIADLHRYASTVLQAKMATLDLRSIAKEAMIDVIQDTKQFKKFIKELNKETIERLLKDA